MLAQNQLGDSRAAVRAACLIPAREREAQERACRLLPPDTAPAIPGCSWAPVKDGSQSKNICRCSENCSLLS
ncbi:hypothetical protein scyTo_0010280 [Scyliorhinus torazame]|uniref:Uncharacterized protein n=1 Tax=Scyliorhinus torazame TaxID=75743 RepID=A0A401P3G2_SCYTO|nr:hypothetical protein [Scyliorhinus torazame]